MSKGILVVVSGFSGAGKGTLMKALMEEHGEDYALSISATTRLPREGEKDGKEYFFLTKEEFEKRIADGDFIEYAKFVNNYYGTPRDYVEKKLEEGKNVILEIEVQGAMQIKKQLPNTMLIFITPPSAEHLKERLLHRGTETAEEIKSRLERSTEEAVGMEDYDYVLVNDEISRCMEEMHQTIMSEKERRSKRNELIAKMQEDIKQFKKGE